MNRTGKTFEGSHEYQIADGITACLMGNNLWTVFMNGQDTGYDFKTLAAARKWAKANQN
jgi:hypothetical protein